ncbi:MAG: hypothetical protein ACOCX4_08255 [Planctomycetota bacterium]
MGVLAVGLLFGWSAMALIGWIFGGAPGVGVDAEGLPTLDVEQVNALPREKRGVALEAYGKALAAARRGRDDSGGGWRVRGRDEGEENPVRQTLEKLSEEDRHTVMRTAWQTMREDRNDERMQEIRAFYALSEAERDAELDRRIDEMQARMAERRKEMEARRAERESRGDAGGDADNRRPEGERRHGDGERQPPTEEERLSRFREFRLDDTTPEERAMQQAYFEALRKRMEARGIEMRGPGRRR